MNNNTRLVNVAQNNFQLNNCKIINVVWIERGIILALIYHIIKKYDILLNKIVIVDNLKYRNFLKLLFPKIDFRKYTKDDDNNFYFNIRKIIKNQDIIIDYLDNYDKYIYTKKINLLPWFDMNDIVVSYEYNPNKKLKLKKIIKFIKFFSTCRRSNYKNIVWDVFVENYIFKKYVIFNKYFNIDSFVRIFNDFIRSNYTNMVFEYPIVYYFPTQKQSLQVVESKKIDDENSLNKLIELLNEKLSIINKIL